MTQMTLQEKARYMWQRLSDQNTLLIDDLPERYIEHCLQEFQDEIDKLKLENSIYKRALGLRNLVENESV